MAPNEKVSQKSSIASWGIPFALAIYLVYYIISGEAEDEKTAPESKTEVAPSTPISPQPNPALATKAPIEPVAPAISAPIVPIAQVKTSPTEIPLMGSLKPPEGFPAILKVGQTEQEMRWVKPGKFIMGSPESESYRRKWENQHAVTITEGYWLGKYEVRQKDWIAMGMENPSHFKGPDHPVEKITWEEAMEFCKNLNQKVAPSLNLPEGYYFRLPTEAEWELSCRAGTTSASYFGEDMSSEQANFDGRSPLGFARKAVHRKSTMPAGSFEANSWGFHDMHGNVWEWCLDHWRELPTKEQFNPQAQSPLANSRYRVIKGGSWYVKGWECRSTSRQALKPATRYNVGIGMRVALARKLPH